MRHRNAGFKLGRNTSHRRALLRNLVTAVLVEDRVQTTVAKAKAVRPLVEKMITLGKKGDLHSRRQALSYLMTREAVTRLRAELRKAQDDVGPRSGSNTLTSPQLASLQTRFDAWLNDLRRLAARQEDAPLLGLVQYSIQHLQEIAQSFPE